MAIVTYKVVPVILFDVIRQEDNEQVRLARCNDVKTAGFIAELLTDDERESPYDTRATSSKIQKWSHSIEVHSTLPGAQHRSDRLHRQAKPRGSAIKSVVGCEEPREAPGCRIGAGAARGRAVGAGARQPGAARPAAVA